MTARQVDRWTAGVWRRAIPAVLLWTVALSSCNEIGTPLHFGFYGYSKIAIDVVAQDTTVDGVAYIAGDTVTDTLDFAWPGSALPLKIWVQDTLALRSDMQSAVAAWKNVLIYGEFDAVFTNDSTLSDIIVRGVAPPPSPGPGFVRLAATNFAPAACEGATDFSVSAPDHTKLWTPFRVYIYPKYSLADTATAPCLARVATHELGHALGLFRHSPDTNDIMFPFPSADAPSDGDATTILTLYHQHSDLRPRPATDTIPPAPAPSH